ncbi:MAG: c-type cytochrome biogenesis protein CcmI [Cocleimonas sp.]
MFWIITAILLLIAFAFVLPSLLNKHSNLHDGRREQNIFIANEQLRELEKRFEQGELTNEDYQSTRDELEQSLLSDTTDSDEKLLQSGSKSSWISTLFIALLIPAIAIPVYNKVGNKHYIKELDPKKAMAQSVPKKADGTPDIDTMVAGLQKKLEAEPDNAKGWYMLGRSYMVLKRYPDAVKAYENALKAKPNAANIMLSLADSMAMQSNGEIAGRPVELINKALEIEPDNRTGLWLGGMAASQQKNFPVAIKRWQKVLLQIDNPSEREEVNSLIANAVSQLTDEQKKTLNLSAVANSPKESTSPVVNDVANTGKEITVSISLSEAMKNQANPTDLVFVYAKAMSGPPMPLAAAKIQVKDLPATIVLNDSMAMMPNLKLSAFAEVIVGARVSKSGQPISQNGDLYTEKKSIKAGQKVDLTIDTVLSK